MDNGRSAGKVMMKMFLNSKGFLHQHAGLQGQIVTADHYKSILTIILRHLKKQRP